MRSLFSNRTIQMVLFAARCSRWRTSAGSTRPCRDARLRRQHAGRHPPHAAGPDQSRLDKSGNVIPVIEMLSQTNEILDDAVWIEANELTGHTTSVRTGIPEPTWRKLYGGVQPSKSTSVKVREGLGMLENYAEVDKRPGRPERQQRRLAPVGRARVRRRLRPEALALHDLRQRGDRARRLHRPGPALQQTSRPSTARTS
jgi:hypothetical protein